MKKKHLIIVGTIIISAIVILGLYQTFALSGDITKDTSGYYNITVNDGTTVNVPANSSKTVYYKLTNTNKGTVKYGVGYSGSNITVKYYHDTQDPVTGTVDYGKSKFIKLYIQNTGSTATTATLSTILGYEKGGDLIVPSGYTLVNEKKALSSKEVLQRLGLSYSKETPNFSLTSAENGTNGIYAAEDDLGTSYYFRGNVTNNYVNFAGKAWRIIRINGDGTIRMIYDSLPTEGLRDPALRVNSSDFTAPMNDNAYVGYMYGTAGSSTYESTHSNSTNSPIKNAVDQWYDKNIVNTGYEDYVADAIYCNDRSVYEGTGIGTAETGYMPGNRLLSSTPTLKCVNKNDRFTKSTTLGNGKLTKKVGVVTSDEVMYAGATSSESNAYYLYEILNDSSNGSWTMSPIAFSNGGVYSSCVLNGAIYASPDICYFTSNYAVPVISIKGDAIISGTGTSNNPFKVE